MDIKHSIKCQFGASMKMFKQAVDKCPDNMWDDRQFLNPFWHIAYHTLFFVHLYLQESKESFTPWEKHIKDYEFLDFESETGKSSTAYSKKEIFKYLEFVKSITGDCVDELELDAEVGFDWIPFNRFELHIHNIKHIQHHTGQLFERLRTSGNIPVEWERRDPD